MKQKILFAITAFTMIGFNVLCQEVIVPLGTIEEIREARKALSYPRNFYMKDINGILDKYAGFWKVEFEGKEYIFEFYKHTYISRYTTNMKDILHMKLQTKDLNTNEIIYSDFQNPRESPIARGTKYLDFEPEDADDSYIGDRHYYVLESYTLTYTYYLYLSQPEIGNNNKIVLDIYRLGHSSRYDESLMPYIFSDIVPDDTVTLERIENPFEE